MKEKSNANTNKKVRLSDVAEVLSGVYAKSVPTGGVACLQVKDLFMPSPEITATHIENTPRIANYILKKGNLLFAGKGTTYLCQIFNHDILAVPSTTLYSIRLRSDILSPEYLCWYMNHPSIVAIMKAAQAGSSTPLIHKATLENLEIIIPDKQTQRLVVELASLQRREEKILKEIAEKRRQITEQLLINVLNK